MKARLLMVTLLLILCLSLISCGSSSESGSTNDSEQKQSEDAIYGIGDTWEVDGQWKMTIDSVAVTDQRNEFADSQPAEVIIINYTYENIGYEDKNGIMNGLFLDIEMGQIVDAAGQMCQSYPASEVINYAQETPVGATCSAQAAIGLSAAGSPVKITLIECDGNGNEQKATFELVY